MAGFDGGRRGNGNSSAAGNLEASVARVENHVDLLALHDRLRTSIATDFHHVLQRFRHRRAVPDLVYKRHTHCHDQPHDADNNHDLDERKGRNPKAETRNPNLASAAIIRISAFGFLSDFGLRVSGFHPPLDFEFETTHQRVILAVIANIAERTLRSRNPTPTAITTIITGSNMFNITLRAMLSS